MITRSLLIRRSVVEEDDIFVTLPTGSGKSLINQKNGADRHTRLLRFVAFVHLPFSFPGTDLGGVCRGCAPLPEMICGFLIQLMFTSGHHSVTPFLNLLLKKNSGSAPAFGLSTFSVACSNRVCEGHFNLLYNEDFLS